MKNVKFTSDFATKRIGDVCEYDGQVASQLVNVDQVAEYTTDPITEVVPNREHIEVPSEVAIGKKAADAPNKNESDSENDDDDDDDDDDEAAAEKAAAEAALAEAAEKEAAEKAEKEAAAAEKAAAKAAAKEPKK